MNNRVLVRSSLRVWDVVLLLLLGLVLIAVGVFFALVRLLPLALFLCWPVGILCAVGATLGWLWRVQRRQWVRDTGTGFEVSDRRGEFTVQDDEVVTLSLRHNNHYSGGVLDKTTRILCVWVATHDSHPEKMEFRTTFKAAETDPLHQLIQRLCQRLFDQAQDDLQRGLSVLGEHWKWEDGELTIRDRDGTKDCRLTEVTAIEIIDGHVCVWRKGQDEVWARVPQGSANAYLLEWLLVKELGQRPADNTPPPEGELGRIIFQRDSRKYRYVGAFLAALVFLGGILVLIIGLDPRHRDILWAAPLCMLGAVLLVVYEISTWRSCFRCHEYGVYQRGLLTEKTLRYLDVKAFTYSAVRQFVNGAYTGTILNLSFEPEEGSEKITYNTTVHNPDAALDNLRDHVSRVVAAKLRRQLDEGETVIWTPQISVRSSGLLCKPTGFFGSKPQQLIPFADIQSYNIQEGYFYLWLRGEKKAYITEGVTNRNFFPGFFLFLSLMHPPQQPAAPEPTSEGIEILEEAPRARSADARQEDPYAR